MKKEESEVAKVVEQRHPGWEYVGGYEGSDGRIDIRCLRCRTVKNVSYITARHYKRFVCEHCEATEREQKKKEQSRIQKIVREFNRPIKKTEQIQAKTCPECGAFYFTKKEACPDCITARWKRYDNRRRDLKKRGSHTAESKLISARTLYERDGGVCWICGGMCDINADPNSNLYPSVDHMIPQSMGGMDTLDNVRLAHRICNSLRSNNVNITEVRKNLAPYGQAKNI